MAPRVRVILCFGLSALLSYGCKRSATPSRANASSQASAGRLRGSNEVGIRWTAPSGWTSTPPDNPMRKAVYRIAPVGSDREPAELVLYYFGPGQGGDVDLNVKRWTSQFSGISADDVKRADRTAHGLHQHTVEIASGTYQSGMPGSRPTPKPAYGLLGAIVNAPTGEYFFKLTGPSATVQAAREAYYQLLDSVEPAD